VVYRSDTRYGCTAVLWRRDLRNFLRALRSRFSNAKQDRLRPGQRPSRRRLPRERLERVKVLIDTRCAEPIYLDAMAETACVSGDHFLRAFRRACGQTPYRVLVNRRLQAARGLLVSENLSVQEISQRV
jgi:AraC family transcriptional regulator